MNKKMFTKTKFVARSNCTILYDVAETELYLHVHHYKVLGKFGNLTALAKFRLQSFACPAPTLVDEKKKRFAT